MLDLIVGIVIVGFVILGIREGIAKSLGSVVLVFATLFLATAVIDFLAKSSPRFGDPSYLAAVIIFLLIWAASFVLLDLLLTVILKKVITIVILGPFDKVGGLLIGGFKGVLICGIVLQLILYFPISEASAKSVEGAALSRFCIAAYRWVYPHAKRIAPQVSDFIRKEVERKTGEMERLGKEVAGEKEEKIKKLLKEEKLLPTVPQGPSGDRDK